MSIFNMTGEQKTAAEVGLAAGILGTIAVSAIAGGSSGSKGSTFAQGSAASKPWPKWVWVLILAGISLVVFLFWYFVL